MLLPRATAAASPPRPRGRPKATTTASSGGAARRGGGAAADPAATLIGLADGRVVGTLCGKYTFEDSAFARAGMVVVVVEAGAAGAALLTRLQPKLRFLSFGLQLRARRRDVSGNEEEEGDDAGESGDGERTCSA